MRWPRRFVSVWWLTLLVVSCLCARPLHEALDLWQAGQGIGARAVAMGQPRAMGSLAVTQPGTHAEQDDAVHSRQLAKSEPLTAADRDGASSQDRHDSQDRQEGEDPQPGTCAWCLMLAGQAQAPASVPALLIQHAEASPPPVALPQGLPAGPCLLAAAPRGPPQA